MPALLDNRRVVVVDDIASLSTAVTMMREAGADVDVLPAELDRTSALKRCVDASVIVTRLMRFADAEISALRAARLIVRAGIGYDNVDVAAATRSGIWVANVPEFCLDEVADHTMLLLLACTRRLPQLLDKYRIDRGADVLDVPEIRRIRGRRLGVAGFGRIGRRVAARAAAFGWDVVATGPRLLPGTLLEPGVQAVSQDEMLHTSDALTLHCPLNKATRHFIDAVSLRNVKPGLTLVNTSRGGLVDLDALYAAIVDGRVAAAGLDTLEGEPTPDFSHPIFQRPEVLVTPHVAWYSTEAVEDLARQVADEVMRVVGGGQPKNAINPAARSVSAI